MKPLAARDRRQILCRRKRKKKIKKNNIRIGNYSYIARTFSSPCVFFEWPMAGVTHTVTSHISTASQILTCSECFPCDLHYFPSCLPEISGGEGEMPEIFVHKNHSGRLASELPVRELYCVCYLTVRCGKFLELNLSSDSREAVF